MIHTDSIHGTEKNQASPKETLEALLSALTKEELAVVTHRYGLFDEEALSRKEVALALGVTSAQAQQREIKALRKLRHPESGEASYLDAE